MSPQEIEDIINNIKPEEFYVWLLGHSNEIFVGRNCALCPLAKFLKEKFGGPVNVFPHNILVFEEAGDCTAIETPIWMLVYMNAFDNLSPAYSGHTSGALSVYAYESRDFSLLVAT